jgi:hypothetical protein
VDGGGGREGGRILGAARATATATGGKVAMGDRPVGRAFRSMESSAAAGNASATLAATTR